MKKLATLLLCIFIPWTAHAESLLVAVASNFLATAQDLQEDYARRSGERIELSSGSTGTLYTKIMHGAPYDIFLAADSWRPELLLDNGHGQAGSDLTYAIGHLVLWAPGGAPAGSECPDSLTGGEFTHLAIANPDTAPYGMAAQQALEKMGLWENLEPNLVRAENVSQAYRFVATGSAQLGFVASSQLQGDIRGCSWAVPQEYYAPIRQQAVIISDSKRLDQASRFMKYLASDEARTLIQEAGYGVPDEL